MKLLYVDPICYKAHAYYNKRNVEILSEICELSVLFTKNYIDTSGISLDKVYEYRTPQKYFIEFNPHNNALIKRLVNKIGQIKIINEIKNLIKKQRYDLIFFSGVDMHVFSRLTKHLKNPIAFVEHAIYRTLIHKGIKKCWKIINKSFKVCVFEDYIAKYLKEQLHVKNDVFVVHHPICGVEQDVDNVVLSQNESVNVLAPAFSNSKEIIDEIIAKSNALKDNVKIAIKGQVPYSDGRIEIFSGFIPRERYTQLFVDSDYILIPYNKDFMFRASGVLFDSIIRKKRIILIGGNTLEYYGEKYPNIIKIVRDVDELINYLNNSTRESVMLEYNELFYKDVKSFLNDYSDKVISKDYKRLLESVNQ